MALRQRCSVLQLRWRDACIAHANAGLLEFLHQVASQPFAEQAESGMELVDEMLDSMEHTCAGDACDASPEVQCPVCFRVEGGDTLLLEQLECDPRHKVCSECMTRIVSHARSQRISVSCPLCRASLSLWWLAPS